MTLGDICDLKTNFPEADFWIQRRGDKSSVGKPLKEYYKENIGVRVKDEYRDKVDPTYLYYYFMFLHQKGVFEPISHGTLKLQNIRLSDIKSIPVNFSGDVLSESIKASEAYDDLDSIQTIIDGKRDIAFLATSGDPRVNNEKTLKAIRYATDNWLNFIEVDNRREGRAWVVYKNNKENAIKLAGFAASKNGYLNDQTPEEALLVGRLLDYDEKSISEYIKKRYYKGM